MPTVSGGQSAELEVSRGRGLSCECWEPNAGNRDSCNEDRLAFRWEAKSPVRGLDRCLAGEGRA